VQGPRWWRGLPRSVQACHKEEGVKAGEDFQRGEGCRQDKESARHLHEDRGLNQAKDFVALIG